MSERSIIFNAEQVRAVFAGTKTQHRVVVKNSHDEDGGDWSPEFWNEYAIRHPERYASSLIVEPSLEDPEGEESWDYFNEDGGGSTGLRCPYGRPGQRIWVKETWAAAEAYDAMVPGGIKPYGVAHADCVPHIWYMEDDDNWLRNIGSGSMSYQGCTRSSTHMPRWASRITLKITDVRAERVQDITQEDAYKEGVTCPAVFCNSMRPIDEYSELWDTTNAKKGYGWDSNPWVWALTFEVVK